MHRYAHASISKDIFKDAGLEKIQMELTSQPSCMTELFQLSSLVMCPRCFYQNMIECPRDRFPTIMEIQMITHHRSKRTKILEDHISAFICMLSLGFDIVRQATGQLY